MSKLKSIKILSLLLAAAMVLTVLPLTAAAEDSSTPVLSALTADPASAQPGETVTVSVTVTDESGISIVRLIAHDSNYNQMARNLPMTRQAQTDTYQAEFTIPVNAVNGSCTINIYAEDEHENGITQQFSQNVLTVAGGSSDTAGPEIGGLLTVLPMSAAPNGTVTVSVEITDDSQIEAVTLDAFSQQGNTKIRMVTMSRQAQTDTYQASFPIPSDAVNRGYTVTINAVDMYSNRSSKDFTDAFTVTGGHDDIRGPLIGDTLTVSPQSVQPGGTVTVSVAATDLTAVDEVTLSATLDPIGGSSETIDASMTRQGGTDTYQGTFTVPAGAFFKRSYPICIEAYDTHGNRSDKEFRDAFAVTAGTVAGTTDIGGISNVDLSIDHDATACTSGTHGHTPTGWTWDTDTATLALTSLYTGEPIRINTGDNSPVILTFTDGAGVTNSVGYALIAQRPLSINGTGTLTLSGTSAGVGALYAAETLTVSGGTVATSASGSNSTILAAAPVTVSGSASMSATNTGTGDAFWLNAGMQINTSGTVAAAVANRKNAHAFDMVSNSSIAVQKGTVTSNGNIGGNLTVSGASVSVTVNGGVTGNLTVSDGTATVTGTVSGTTTHTGGTLNGNAPAGGAGEIISWPNPPGNGVLATVNGQENSLAPSGIAGNNPGSKSTNLSGNSVTVNSGGTVGGAVFGAVNSSDTDPVTGNRIFINSGADVGGGIIGGVNSLLDAGSAATGNSVTMTGGTVGTGGIGGTVYGGFSGGIAENNSVAISGGTVRAFDSGGGRYSNGHVWGGSGILSGAKNNTVAISGSAVVGGSVSGGSSDSGAATGNTVIINGGEVHSNVIGGDSSGGATGNTVTISGGPTIAGTLYGGAAGINGSAAVKTGNKLKLYSTNLTVAGVENFEFINFYLPATITNDATMLTTTAATDLNGVTLDLAFDTTAPTLAVGNTITLIDNATGTFTSNNVTLSGYTYALSVSGGKLIATVTAVPAPPPPTYLVTVNNGTGGGNYAQGAIVTITADATPNGQTFDKWTTASSGITFANANSASTSFTMPAHAVTVTANYKSDGNGSVNSGGGSGGAPTQTAPAADGTVKIAYSQSGGAVTLSLPDSKLNEIIGASKGTATVDLSGITGGTSAVLPKEALNKLAGTQLSVALKLPQGTLTLDEAAAKSIASQASGTNVSIQLNQTTALSLNSAQREAIRDGDLVFNISASSGSQNITAFDGTLTVTLPYDGPLPAGVWYLNSAGELEKLECVYNAATKTVSFTLTHFSLYVLGQNESAPEWVNPFTDVSAGDWFYDFVQYAHQNSLFSGTSASTFSPGVPMTRAMLATVLWRMDSQPVVDGLYADFADVAQGSWYEDAVGWAAKNGIVSGVGEGFFTPEASVAREQMAVMLYQYMKHHGYAIPAGAADAFADEDSVSVWALEAVRAIRSMGIVSGRPNNLFDPQGPATRAEVATVFARFAELVSDQGTAQAIQ